MILVSGEALIDMLPFERNGAQGFAPLPGGSPFNLAIALGRLGASPRFLCPLSRDPFGQQLAAALAASRVDLSLCPRTDALSTLGFVTLDPVTRTAHYAFYTEGTAAAALTERDLPALPSGIVAIHVGSFSLALEPFGSTIESLLAKHGQGRMLSLDPNIRPALVERCSHHRARLDRLLRQAHLVKVSVEDLEWLRPGMTPRQFADACFADSTELVVVTRGGDGATAFTRSASASVPAAPAELADTVGAGDTFQAALLAALAAGNQLSIEGLRRLDHSSLHALLTFAAHAAAVTCSRVGCDPPWSSELPAPPKLPAIHSHTP